MKKLSVVVPVYYNEHSLRPLYDQLSEVEKELSSRDLEVELIFVDDGSGDDSLNELLKIKKERPDTRIVKLSRNFGAVHASKAGLQFATGDCFMIIAADLQDPPRLVVEMADKWLAGARFVVCARRERVDPPATKAFAYLYYRAVRAFVIKDYPEGGYDMALMDKALLPYFQNSSKSLYTPLLGYWLGYKPEFIYYTREKRLHGKSRWTFFKKWNAFLDSILGYSVTPLRAVSFVGFITALVSFFYGLWMLINGLLGTTEVRGFATIVVLVSFFSGMIILALSLVGEYLWRIFEELNKRPEVVIEEVY